MLHVRSLKTAHKHSRDQSLGGILGGRVRICGNQDLLHNLIFLFIKRQMRELLLTLFFITQSWQLRHLYNYCMHLLHPLA